LRNRRLGQTTSTYRYTVDGQPDEVGTTGDAIMDAP
jgi:hypothetical protein